MKPIKFIIALFVFATATYGQAAPLLNGLALEQQFNKDRYIAAVYSDTLADDPGTLLNNDTTRRLEVRVLANSLSARRFRNQWMEGIAINNPGSTLSGQADNMVTFANLFQGRFKKGDHLTVDFDGLSGTSSVALNGMPLGQIEDREFFNTLLRAWVGSVPPSSDFRDGLLAAGDVSSSLLGTYELLEPSEARIAEVTEQFVQTEEGTEEETVAAAEPSPSKPEPSAKPRLAAEIPPPTLASVGASPEPKAPVAASKPQPSKPQPQAIEPEEEEEEDEGPLTADLILARQLYHSQLMRHTYGHIEYPRRAQERGQEGSVRLSVTIDAQGRVQDIQPVQDSRYAILNRAAREAVEDASPYPAAPPQLIKDSFRFTMPITFRLAN